MLDLFRICHQHLFQHIAVSDQLVGHLYPLKGGQFGADQLLQSLLEFRVAHKAQLNDKTHHRGFRHADLMPQSGGGHVGGFVIVFQQVAGDLPLPFGKALHIFLYDTKNILFHFSVRSFPLS